MTASLQELRRATQCEVRDDTLVRQLYATDASIYQVEPLGVAFPQSAAQAAEAVGAAASFGIPVIPRGAGTGLAGGALGRGLILDCARHNRLISELDTEAMTVRVGAGVVLDQLNAYLQPHGLLFGPDVATSSRATLGGMIANNSSGARTPYYGVTIDHVLSLELVMADGSVRTVRADEGLGDTGVSIDALLRAHASEIGEQLHPGVIKRWPGYGIDRYLRSGGDLVKVFGGSEGTLAGIFSAELRLMKLPRDKGLALLFFHSVDEAMQATVELLDLDPVAIEHIDDVLFDQTRGQLQFQAARDYLRLDLEPCTSILIVEFYGDDVDAKLHATAERGLGYRRQITRDGKEMGHVWALRKAGLTLLTGRPGDAKPTAGIEDVAVPPEKLPDYVCGLKEIMRPLGLHASFYGHGASGLLHVRPVVDLHQAEDLRKFRQVADGVAALTKQFRGAIAAEHGVGIARTEYLPEHLGDLLGVMREIKQALDPQGVFNPGKIFSDGRYTFDTNLRQGAGHRIELPFEPVLLFAAKDKSFVGNLEQCNGNGACRKWVPTMCPTYIATGEEIMSTRGRANTIRASLEGRLGEDPLSSTELDQALKYCLSCKACKTECPSNVDLALQKAELEHARQRRDGVSLQRRFVSRADLVNALASRMPRLANRMQRAGWVRALMEQVLGFDRRRTLPELADEPFHMWFYRRKHVSRGTAGRVILWDDCFVRYNEPHIGQAAVRVLEAAGYEVVLPENRSCCGRPAFSSARLDVAKAMGEANAKLLQGDDPIVFLEPSCFSMFADDYRELGVTGAEALAGRAMLFERFMDEALAERPDALRFAAKPRKTAVHVHCHAKALTNQGQAAALARRIPGNEVTQLNTACCGMAGSYGFLKEKYEVSIKTGAHVIELVDALADDTHLVASGTSCRHQIVDLSRKRPLHMAELLCAALDEELERTTT